MAEAQQPGSPAPQAAPAAPAAPAESAEPKGLEKVYSDFKVEADASNFNPQSPRPAQPQPQAPSVPKFDPFDPNFSAHMATIATGATEAHKALQQAEGRLNAIEQRIHSREVEGDIKQAVGILTDGNGLKPKLAEVAMEAKAREDARFRSVWLNRGKNPAAYQAALKAFKQELQDEYTVRQDPQLAENQRAVKVSQQQMATTTKTSQSDEWASMSPGERQAKVQIMLRQGGR